MGRDGLASLPGAWRGPTGDVFSGDEFKTKFVPALMHGTWKRVFDLSRCTLNFTNSAYSKEEGVRYTGKPFEPVVRVSDGGGYRLVEGTDYTVSYENNIDAGTATVVVTGIGKASGTNTLTFKIAPAPISIPKAKTGLVYNGKKLTGVKAGSGFSATNNTARAAGSYTATLTADRNHVFTGGKSTVKVKWSIAKASQEVSAKSCSSTVKVKKSSKVKALGKNVTVLFKKKAGVSAKTTVRYAKSNAAGGKKIVVNKKTGKVTLKKGLKVGTYKVKIKLSALAGKNYKPASKLVTLKVTIH